MSDEPGALNSSDSWSRAKRYARQLSPIPSSVKDAVAAAWLAHEENADETGEFPYSLSTAVNRVDRSAVLKTPLYFAASSLFPDRFTQTQEDDSSLALVKILSSGVFASLLSLIYLHRRLNKICKSEQWSELSKEYVLNMELGFLIGSSSPQIGPAAGTLVGGIRCAALATFLLRDEETYERYRNVTRKQFSVTEENSRYGCDHGQVASYILGLLGIQEKTEILTYAFRGHQPSGVTIPDSLKSWLVVSRIIDSIKAGKTTAEADLSDTGMTLETQELAEIDRSTQALFESGSKFGWMFRGSTDASE